MSPSTVLGRAAEIYGEAVRAEPRQQTGIERGVEAPLEVAGRPARPLPVAGLPRREAIEIACHRVVLGLAPDRDLEPFGQHEGVGLVVEPVAVIGGVRLFI